MKHSDELTVERGFVDLVLHGPVPSTDAFAEALDRLALSRWSMPDIGPGNEGKQPPDTDWSELSDRIRQRFPNLGFYSSAAHDDPIGPALVGDATDDLADIIHELLDAIWSYDNISREAGIWELRFGFDTHWGQHLRDLSRYLHISRFR